MARSRVLEIKQRENELTAKEIMKPDRGFKSISRKKAGLLAVSGTTRSQSTPGKPYQSAQNHSRTVTIEAQIDVGFGNTLYLRGDGHGLSWNQGVPLTCVDASTWKWSGEAEDELKFKLLLNDAIWSKGEDLVVAPGEKVQVAPAF